MFRRLLLLTLGYLLLLSAMQSPQPGRIVAVADVHGDLDALVGLLQRTALIDGQRRWTGGRATLVQLGDFLDRGPQSRSVMDLLMTLEQSAPRGSVLVGLGNHEVMNIFGDLRYVPPEGFASFVDRNSERRREDAYRSYVRHRTERGQPVDEEAWKSAHPPGFVEHRAAFAPDGKYGRWLRRLPAVRVVGDTIFLHGGISPGLAGLTVEQINRTVALEIEMFDSFKKYMMDRKLVLPFFTFQEIVETASNEMNVLQAMPETQRREQDKHIRIIDEFLQLTSWFTIHEEGPLWFRGYSSWTEEEGTAKLASILETLDARRIVVGHTPQPDASVRRRFGGTVFLIDTGMLSSYYEGGRASALEILNGRIRAIYPDGQTELN